MLFLLIIVFAGTILYEIPDLIRKGYWRLLFTVDLKLAMPVSQEIMV